ncbi:transcription factor binding protein [Ceraceosorus bombacis]|uniref:Transcription factor binding protein n=1 Tax=Ceraceosorus bombacis TaxID=401625 RepID=A0A0P1BKX9_9BASI|nr:transcription factor binding protein [Ceraceosorus bombacis]
MSTSPPLSSPGPQAGSEQVSQADLEAPAAQLTSTSKSPSPDSSSSVVIGSNAGNASNKAPRGRGRGVRGSSKARRSSRSSAKRTTSEGLQTPAIGTDQLPDETAGLRVEAQTVQDEVDDAQVDGITNLKAEAADPTSDPMEVEGASPSKAATVPSEAAARLDLAETEPGASEAAEAVEAATDGAKDSSSRSSTRQSGSGSPHPASASDKHRQRSTSTFKELASLGLHSFGDGEDGQLPPRRSRRAANSPDRSADEVKEGSEPAQESKVGETQSTELHESAESVLVDQKEEHLPPDWQGEELEGGEGETRCVCGSPDENVGLMIQCDSCKCWQHCICMGLHTEDDCPDVYFCEQCRPELHITLLRSLGVLPVNKSHKKGASKALSKLNSKDAKRELKEAKQAVLLLAADNERRRKAGEEVLTGWSVAHNPALAALAPNSGRLSPPSPTQPPGSTGGAHRRQSSDAQGTRHGRSQSREEDLAHRQGRASPKRRSTMNSRDSAYGWEPIPPGLLNEDEQWDEQGNDKMDEDDRNGNKRKRGRNEASPTRSPSPADGPAADYKRRKPKHPNQYTYRAKDRATAAASAAAVYAAGGAGPSSSGTPQQSGAESPSPSPHKQRAADQAAGGARRAALRDQSGISRTGTPTPHLDSTKPGGNLGMPEHLFHLAHLLSAHSSEALSLHPPLATKGVPRSGGSRGAANKEASGNDAESSSAPVIEPMPYTSQTLHEPRTKIRFPPKRMTLGEMRKRVRNIGEYVTRSQVEAVERSRRTKLLGIKISLPGDAALLAEMGKREADADGNRGKEITSDASKEEGSAPRDKSDALADAAGAHAAGQQSQEQLRSSAGLTTATEHSATASANAEPSASTSSNDSSLPGSGSDTPLSMRLVEELSRELARFNQRFGGLPAYGLSA